jgi:hypothetical protein
VVLLRYIMIVQIPAFEFCQPVNLVQATDKTAYCYMRTMLTWVAAQSACGC